MQTAPRWRKTRLGRLGTMRSRDRVDPRLLLLVLIPPKAPIFFVIFRPSSSPTLLELFLLQPASLLVLIPQKSFLVQMLFPALPNVFIPVKER